MSGCNVLQRDLASRGDSSGSRCVTVFRWHARTRRGWSDAVRLVVKLLQRAAALRVLFECIERYLKEMLRGLGLSQHRLRRLVSIGSR